MKPRLLRLAPLVLPVLLAGCADGPGEGWAVLDTASLEGRLEVADGRRTADGWIRLASDWQIRLDRFEWRFAEAALIQLERVGGGSGEAFDPANPPAGYSLCHNGHCHADDGRLVDYAEIEAELRAGGDGIREVVLQRWLAPLLDLLAGTPQTLDCDPLCALPADMPEDFRLRTAQLRMEGAVRDGRDPPRRQDIHAWQLDVADAIELRAALAWAAGERRPARIDMRASLTVPVQLFDGVSWATIIDAGGIWPADAREGLLTALAAADLEVRP